jgi:hypothetical protein
MKIWLIVSISVLTLLFASAALSRYRQTDLSLEPAQSVPIKAQGTKTPVIVELFTSEGCSSCPPADEVLADLERTQPVSGAEIIALGEHVDYWNYIGWADPFSAPIFSERQNDYANAFSNSSAYTPQMVVDGQVEFVGSKMSKALDAIADAARAPKAKVQITAAEENPPATFSVQTRITEIPTIKSGETVEIILAITESDLQSNVVRGENAGRRLKHGTVVRELKVIGSGEASPGVTLSGKSTMTIKKGWQRDHLRAVVFIQERKSRRVIGASALKLAQS